MFIKLGDYRFNEDDIVCIKRFPSGCRVYLRSGVTMDVIDDLDKEFDIINSMTYGNQYISKEGEDES